jgi:hypothetical protein
MIIAHECAARHEEQLLRLEAKNDFFFEWEFWQDFSSDLCLYGNQQRW